MILMDTALTDTLMPACSQKKYPNHGYMINRKVADFRTAHPAAILHPEETGKDQVIMGKDIRCLYAGIYTGEELL